MVIDRSLKPGFLGIAYVHQVAALFTVFEIERAFLSEHVCHTFSRDSQYKVYPESAQAQSACGLLVEVNLSAHQIIFDSLRLV